MRSTSTLGGALARAAVAPAQEGAPPAADEAAALQEIPMQTGPTAPEGED